jgi:hypothetical protein
MKVPSGEWDWNVGAPVPSGDLSCSVETANPRSSVSGRDSHFFIERGAVRASRRQSSLYIRTRLVSVKWENERNHNRNESEC